MRDGETVSLVANALQEIEPLARPRQDDRVLLTGHPDLLEPLRQPDHGDVVDPELVERALGGSDLRRATVDDDQARRVGELAWAAGVGVDQDRPALLLAVLGAPEVHLGGLRALVEQPPETASDRLVHRGDVVLPVDALDHEPAVVALARQAVLEHDHRRDHLGALEVGHVVALDAQRCLLEPERELDLLEGLGAGGEVAGALGLVGGERLPGVAGDGLHQDPLVAALRHPQRDLASALVAQPGRQRGGSSGCCGTSTSRGMPSDASGS